MSWKAACRSRTRVRATERDPNWLRKDCIRSGAAKKPIPIIKGQGFCK